MEFTVSNIDELREKLDKNGYDNDQISNIVEMYEDRTSSDTQTITVSPPK